MKLEILAILVIAISTSYCIPLEDDGKMIDPKYFNSLKSWYESNISAPFQQNVLDPSMKFINELPQDINNSVISPTKDFFKDVPENFNKNILKPVNDNVISPIRTGIENIPVKKWTNQVKTGIESIPVKEWTDQIIKQGKVVNQFFTNLFANNQKE
jgi:hypothetical protein